MTFLIETSHHHDQTAIDPNLLLNAEIGNCDFLDVSEDAAFVESSPSFSATDFFPLESCFKESSHKEGGGLWEGNIVRCSDSFLLFGNRRGRDEQKLALQQVGLNNAVTMTHKIVLSRRRR
jgi:hypothetical protein